MSGSAGEARAGAGRTSTVGILLAVLLAAALAGFLLGAVVGEDEVDVPQGLLFAAVSLLLGLGATAGAWWWIRRRAAQFGLSASRYLRVGRRVQRGELPEDSAEFPAAIDIVARQRRTLDTQQRRWVRWVTGAAALLWLVSAVIQILAARYGYACFQLLVACGFLVNPLTARRQRRRLDAVEQALHDHRTPRGTP
ncbi:hypothetical protein SUDANB15_00246 [Streptomyces sp. enrichment culture]|uniref:hypothetical protein n=1 Tax=Streptomyces sp. enrichment culture TaxID=1795815 RepID=UPI003F56F3D0